MAALAYRHRIDNLEDGYHFQHAVSRESEYQIHEEIPYLRRYPLCNYEDKDYTWVVTVDFSRQDTVLGYVETLQIVAGVEDLKVSLPMEEDGGRYVVPYGEMDVTILLCPNDIDKILNIMERNGDISLDDVDYGEDEEDEDS